MKQNLKPAVNLTALVLAAGLLIGLTGCFQLGSSKRLPLFKTDGYGVITGYTCAQTDLPKALVIPAKIGNEVITGISDGVFYGCTGLTSLDLSACTSLTVIGGLDRFRIDGAFEGCTGLTEVKLPASLTKIDNSAFKGCTGLTGELNLPASLTKIGSFAFFGCTGLTSIDLSGCTSLTKIGRYAFDGCKGLTEVKLPASLTEIDGFSDCTGLTSIDLSGCTSLTKIGWYAFDGCKGLTEVKLPASLTEIDGFSGCTGLTSIDLSACTSLTVIGVEEDTVLSGGAFEGCTGLTEVKLPASLTEIGEKAFRGCSNLAGTIVFPASLKTIKSYRESSYPYNIVGAFQGCTKLQGADFSACTNFTKIENSTFKNCTSLTEVKLPASLNEIGKEAFKDCTGLTSAVFADKHNWKAGGTPISSTALDNAETAALYLRQTYVDKYWKKN